MARMLAVELNSTNWKRLILLSFVFVALTLGLDKLESAIRGSRFYFSESLLFSSIWWLFVPFLYAQQRMLPASVRRPIFYVPALLIPVSGHLLMFPAVVWLISALAGDHTFRYSQTFQYGFVEYGLHVLLIYALPIGYALFLRSAPTGQPVPEPAGKAATTYPSTFIVAEGSRRIPIAADDIFYVSANSPYINLHHRARKYIYNDTLRSFSEKLDGDQFVRVHKSVIVNIREVKQYQSRQNGDYDLLLTDGTQLRMSRHYVRSFRAKLPNALRLP